MKLAMLARRVVFTTFTIVFLSHLLPIVSYADNATVLPKGVYQLQLETAFFFPVDERYSTDGKKEDIATPFNIPLVGLFPGLPAGTDLGRSVVSLQLKQTEAVWTPAYGLTDRFSIGMKIPYIWARSDIGTGTDNSTANRGKNPAAATPTNPLGVGFPCVALGCTSAADVAAGTTPVNISDVNLVLGSVGFKPLERWRAQGFGDIEIGGRYQYYRSERFRAAFTGGMRLPTGETDDPDNLIDRGLGDGAYALLFQFNQDFLFQPPGLGRRLGFPDPGSFFITTDFRYDLILPDKEVLRVCPSSAPICTTKGEIERDLGDRIQAEFQTTLGLLFTGLVFNSSYRYRYDMKNDFSTELPNIPVEVLEKNSSAQRHEYKLKLSYTTIPLFAQKQFPVPLVFTVTYRDRFAGDNNVNVSRFVGFDFTVYGQ